jgi:hypothetical protein
MSSVSIFQLVSPKKIQGKLISGAFLGRKCPLHFHDDQASVITDLIIKFCVRILSQALGPPSKPIVGFRVPSQVTLGGVPTAFSRISIQILVVSPVQGVLIFFKPVQVDD